ncbi:MAG: DNA helicase RecQ [Oscillospiraceae bacterium]|nr:DNA helicase RecQ [Oscillospiraceae bacterium]
MDPREILQRFFGYEDFRPGQRELINALLAGRDVFGVMPTGGGKSLCYQVPGLMFPGITLVVSPLISLMRDQVLALKEAGLPAAYINSTLTSSQIRMVYRNLLAGMYKIVYVAPERLDYGGFLNVVSQLPISFVAIDEAHCISQWGQDFRPSYLRIVNFLETLPERPVVGAFTATATLQVQEDVERILKLCNPIRVVTGFDRPNLYFEVRHPEHKDQELLDLLSQRMGKSGIIYCATRKKVESVCELLQQKGYPATRYHAGLEEEERSLNQEDFIHDRKPIMVATNAFGMGIDKSNVSFVIHYNMPKSMEAYYQEAGRAGRDGTPADCILLFANGDVTTAIFLIENSSDNEEMDPETKELIRVQDMERLGRMVGYCNTKGCLRGYILGYFGQNHTEVCENCFNCKGEFEEVDVTRQAQMILSCVKRIYDRLGYYMGASFVLQVLQGSKSQRIRELGLQELSTYGLLAKEDKKFTRSVLGELEAQGFLLTDSIHRSLRLTPKSAEVLYRGQTVTMLVPKSGSAEDTSQGSVGYDETLYDALRKLRGELARQVKLPAFMIFSNATLQDMARKKPRTMAEFKSVSGVGEAKALKYSTPFLTRIRKYLNKE